MLAPAEPRTPPAPAPAAPTSPAARPPRGLDARLAAADRDMTQRLALAHAALSVNAASAETPETGDIDLGGCVALPEPPEPPYPSPAAAALQRARRRLRSAGWCRDATRDNDGALCLYGAVRAEAQDSATAADALTVLLEAIRRRYPAAATVPHANDELLPSAAAAERALEEGASLADARGL